MLGLRAGVLDLVGQFTHCYAKLDVALDFASVDATLLLIPILVGVGIRKLKLPKFDRPMPVEKAMQIKQVMFSYT